MQIVLSDKHNLTQIVKFPTWKRTVNDVMKTSILDHIFVKDPTPINNLHLIEPLTGDHCLLMFNVTCITEPPKTIIKRSWQTYSKHSLLAELETANFNIETDEVPSTWNNFKNALLPIRNKLAPLLQFSNNSTIKLLKPSTVIKTK